MDTTSRYGTSVGSKYEQMEMIGKGSFGKVFKVRDREDRKIYVVKKLKFSDDTESEREAALSEVEVLSQLHHPNIVQYRESFWDSKDHLCIVMGYCENGDLHEKIQEAVQTSYKFPEEQVLDWFVQMCLAIQYIHSKKIVHRDLKSKNIFLTANNMVKLGDFGIAKALQGTMDMATTLIGSPYYMSPEMCQNRPYNYKSDIWALGCVLYELCTLKHAFTAQHFPGMVLKILRGSYPPIPTTYSQGLRDLVATMLSKQPEQRPSVTAILNHPIIRLRGLEFLSQIDATGLSRKSFRFAMVPGQLEVPSEEATTKPSSSGKIGQKKRRRRKGGRPSRATLEAAVLRKTMEMDSLLAMHKFEVQEQVRQLKEEKDKLEEELRHLSQRLNSNGPSTPTPTPTPPPRPYQDAPTPPSPKPSHPHPPVSTPASASSRQQPQPPVSASASVSTTAQRLSQPSMRRPQATSTAPGPTNTPPPLRAIPQSITPTNNNRWVTSPSSQHTPPGLYRHNSSSPSPQPHQLQAQPRQLQLSLSPLPPQQYPSQQQQQPTSNSRPPILSPPSARHAAPIPPPPSPAPSRQQPPGSRPLGVGAGVGVSSHTPPPFPLPQPQPQHLSLAASKPFGPFKPNNTKPANQLQMPGPYIANAMSGQGPSGVGGRNIGAGGVRPNLGGGGGGELQPSSPTSKSSLPSSPLGGSAGQGQGQGGLVPSNRLPPLERNEEEEEEGLEEAKEAYENDFEGEDGDDSDEEETRYLREWDEDDEASNDFSEPPRSSRNPGAKAHFGEQDKELREFVRACQQQFLGEGNNVVVESMGGNEMVGNGLTPIPEKMVLVPGMGEGLPLKKRAERLREYCMHGLGKFLFNRCYKYLQERKALFDEDDEMVMKIEMTEVLGEDNLHYWPIMEELVFCEAQL
mmetsp:Transcript_28141/g.45600  ORF Transcript_28141/g.45600 Transcript_28141/m.45600 type:complete len:908 (+) Transcript_28141:221-2944(+)|eukprot:CAMPEP_0184649338 /NCGR_PEP_ID=MMETSP0308-20130426/6678_1 /TAXON_ID=38269 /ORGANISM="Gloeochaete witrockiana, Strain SAG 46.84" /LENGTH=907 /DNA_ID=CAMNT_0027081979 /DNA_START=134 /DNA_END=2857 /DNA_ORIENTATION=+